MKKVLFISLLSVIWLFVSGQGDYTPEQSQSVIDVAKSVQEVGIANMTVGTMIWSFTLLLMAIVAAFWILIRKNNDTYHKIINDNNALHQRTIDENNKRYNEIIASINQQNNEIITSVNKKYNEIIDRIVIQQDNILKIIEQSVNKANTGIKRISDIISEESHRRFNQITVTAGYSFIANMYGVLTLIADIKRDNNISDRKHVEDKIRMGLENLYNDRLEKFSIFDHNGHVLSSYADKAWIEPVYKFALKSVLDGKPFELRTYLNPLKVIYKDIELKFLYNIKKG